MSTNVVPPWMASRAERWRPRPGLGSLVFGVLLPLGTIGFELATKMCASALFDPMPTPFHVLLVGLVPACNFFVWLSIRRGEPLRRLLAFANGVAIAVAVMYSVLFLPILPLALVSMLYFGIGVLPWSPVFAVMAALSLRRHLKREAEERQHRFATWPGLLCGVLALIVLEAPQTLTQIGMKMATSPSATEQTRGIRLLRSLGNEDWMLRLCYVRTGRATDMLSLLMGMSSVTPMQAREVYYRVTGEAFNAKPAPNDLQPRGWGAFDGDQGTDVVGGRLGELSLASSRFDGSIDANAALGYLEWTLVLRNESDTIREARSQVALPPGAVVSRLTLWVNGEEREAAFAARGEVTAAYRSVVSQRRDPVLVTTAGADRIAVQMFPVPAGGEMKVRIGMTVPLQLDHPRQGTLQLPYFHERNFDVADEFKHSVWVEAKSPLSAGRQPSSVAPSGAHSLQMELADVALMAADSAISVVRENRATVWSQDKLANEHLIKQTLQVVPASRPARLVIVIDSSASMASFVQPIAEALSRLPPQMELFVILADDVADASSAIERTTPLDAAALIRGYQFVGGKDNTAALAHALDKVLSAQDSALVWIHGPQPVTLRTTESIEQRLHRRGQARWFDVQIAPGPNRILERLDGLVDIQTLSLPKLQTQFARWRSGSNEVVVRRERLPRLGAIGLAADQTSDHLARLWANEEVKRLLHVERAPRESIVQLAHNYQLVTPVTGAVVLETQQQYDAAGLTPVPEGTVPSIPEPEEWALMIIAAAVLLYAWRRRRLAYGHAAA